MSDSLQPMDCSPLGSSVHGIIQAGILEWLPFPPSEDLPNVGIKSVFPALACRFFTTEQPGKPWVSPTPPGNSLQHQLSVLQFNSILTLSSWRQRHIPQEKSFILKDCLPLQVPVASPDCHLCFWSNDCKSDLLSLGLINLLVWPTELRETFYSQDYCLL